MRSLTTTRMATRPRRQSRQGGQEDQPAGQKISRGRGSRCLQPARPASSGGVRRGSAAPGHPLLAVWQPERGAAAVTRGSGREGEGRLPPAAGVG